MKPTILMVRHGATEHDKPVAKVEELIGWMDAPLAPIGRSEGFAVGRHLADVPIHKIYTSDLRRAADVAGIIRALHPDRPPVVRTTSLRPQHVGEYTGKGEEDSQDDMLFYQ